MLQGPNHAELDHAIRRGAPRIYASILGYGATADAHHAVAPAPDGAGALNAMRQALRQSSHPPSSVNYINAHATSTLLGDAAESAAIKSLMVDEGGMIERSVNVSSTKGAIGHLLGAAGAVEAIFTILAVKEDILPPTLNLESPSSSLPGFNYVPKITQRHHVHLALTNSFGFGGTNGCLAFGKFDTQHLPSQSPLIKKAKSGAPRMGKSVPSSTSPTPTQWRRGRTLPVPSEPTNSNSVLTLTYPSNRPPLPPLYTKRTNTKSSPLARERKSRRDVSGRDTSGRDRSRRRKRVTQEATTRERAKESNKKAMDKSQYHNIFSPEISIVFAPHEESSTLSTNDQSNNEAKDPGSPATASSKPDQPSSSATTSSQQTSPPPPSPPSSTPTLLSSSPSDPPSAAQPPNQQAKANPPTKPIPPSPPSSPHLLLTRRNRRNRRNRSRIAAGLPPNPSPRKLAKLERKAKKAEKKNANEKTRRAHIEEILREEIEQTGTAPAD
ncbi:MAG: hypothetical protein Q9160_007766 [Pyrenula sp. 1 TL-2023]